MSQPWDEGLFSTSGIMASFPQNHVMPKFLASPHYHPVLALSSLHYHTALPCRAETRKEGEPWDSGCCYTCNNGKVAVRQPPRHLSLTHCRLPVEQPWIMRIWLLPIQKGVIRFHTPLYSHPSKSSCSAKKDASLQKHGFTLKTS